MKKTQIYGALFGVLVSVGAWGFNRAITIENRLTTVETKEKDLKEDVKEIKQTLKDIVKILLKKEKGN